MKIHRVGQAQCWPVGRYHGLSYLSGSHPHRGLLCAPTTSTLAEPTPVCPETVFPRRHVWRDHTCLSGGSCVEEGECACPGVCLCSCVQATHGHRYKGALQTETGKQLCCSLQRAGAVPPYPWALPEDEESSGPPLLVPSQPSGQGEEKRVTRPRCWFSAGSGDSL